MIKRSVTQPTFLALSCVSFFGSAPCAFADAGSGASDASADAPDDDDRSILVNGHLEKAASPKDVAPIVNTPRSVVTIDSAVITRTGSTTLADALRTVPGITFGAAEGGNPIGDRPFIRGFDSQGSTYVDGVRDPASQTRETFAVDSVQIVRGSDSTLGGRGSAGGSINIISKLPVAQNFATASFNYGTADYKRITGDANYMLSDTVGVRVAGMWHDQDVAGRDAIWQKRWGVAPSFTVGLGTDTRLTVAYYYLESHELPDSGIPYLYTIGNVPGTGEIYSQPALGQITTIGGATGFVSRDTFYGLKDRDFRDTKTHQATLRVEHDFGGITLRNTSRFTHNYQAYSFLLPDDSTGNVFGTSATAPTGAAAVRGDQIQGGYVWRRSNNRYGYTDGLTNQTDLYGKFHTGSIEHSFAVGAEFNWEKARRGAYVSRGFLNATSGVEILATGSTITPRCNTATIARYYCTSLFNPNPNDPWVNYTSDTSTTPTPLAKMLPIEETQNDAHTISFYGFDSITLTPSLILNLGARFDRFTSKVTPGLAANATAPFSISRTDELFNYQAGLVFKPTRNTSVYVSYATAATPPNSLIGEGQEPNALPTTLTTASLAILDALKVEKTRSAEIGAKAQLFEGQLALNVAAFQTDTDNARVTGPNNTIEFIGKRRIRGIEFNFNGNVTKWLTVFGGYTYLDPKIVDGGFTALTAPAITQTVGNVTTTIQAAKTVQVVSVNTGRQATQTAKHSFTIWADAKPTERLSIGGGAFYTSRVFGGYADNRAATQNVAGVVTVSPATKVLLRTVPSYWRFDARVGYKVNDKIDVSVNVNNVTNKAYFTQAYTSHYATIAPGRSAFATLNVKY